MTEPTAEQIEWFEGVSEPIETMPLPQIAAGCELCANLSYIDRTDRARNQWIAEHWPHREKPMKPETFDSVGYSMNPPGSDIVFKHRIIDLGDKRVVQELVNTTAVSFTSFNGWEWESPIGIVAETLDGIKRYYDIALDYLNAEPKGEYRVTAEGYNEIRWYVRTETGQMAGLRSGYATKEEAQAECDRLNGVPPVPRIERPKDGDLGTFWIVTEAPDRGTYINADVLSALEQIIGHDIPVWEPKKRYEGEWREITDRPPVDLDDSTNFAWERGWNEAMDAIDIKIYEHTVKEIK